MKSITKVAVGCGVVLLLAVTVGIALFVGGLFWVKGKVEGVAGDEKQIADAKQRANEGAPFTRPADGELQEPRLVKFLEIRKRTYAIYEQHRVEIEAFSKKEKGDLGDVPKAYAWIADLRKAQANAQAEVGMGDEEYAFLVEQVYKSAWAAEVARSTGGQTPSEAIGTAAEQVTEAYRKAQEQLRGAGDERSRQVEDAIAQTEEQAREASEQARSLDVPKANLELYRKYEADIKKYAMNGLEWLGL